MTFTIRSAKTRGVREILLHGSPFEEQELLKLLKDSNIHADFWLPYEQQAGLPMKILFKKREKSTKTADMEIIVADFIRHIEKDAQEKIDKRRTEKALKLLEQIEDSSELNTLVDKYLDFAWFTSDPLQNLFEWLIKTYPVEYESALADIFGESSSKLHLHISEHMMPLDYLEALGRVLAGAFQNRYVLDEQDPGVVMAAVANLQTTKISVGDFSDDSKPLESKITFTNGVSVTVAFPHE